MSSGDPAWGGLSVRNIGQRGSKALCSSAPWLRRRESLVNMLRFTILAVFCAAFSGVTAAENALFSEKRQLSRG